MRSTGSRNTETTKRSTDERARPGNLEGTLGRAECLVAVARRLLHARRPDLLPRVGLPARPGLVVFTTLLLGILCFALATRDKPASPDPAEFVLLSGSSSSNLNSTSAETPAPPPAPPRQVEQGSPEATEAGPPSLVPPPAKAQGTDQANPDPVAPVVSPTAASAFRVAELLAAPMPEPGSPPPAELPGALAAEESLPVVPVAAPEPAGTKGYPVRDPYPGDTPMMRTWQMLGLKALLAALFAATPSLAGSTSGPPSDSEKLVEIQKQLNELKNSLAEVHKSLKDVGSEPNAGVQRALSQLYELKDQVRLLRLDVENLRNPPPGSTRIAGFPPPDTGTGAATARVEMINTYSQPVSIVINNRSPSYRLAPFERRLSEPIPAGPFTYEVLAITPLVTRTVAAAKIFTVWVHPQR